MGNKIVFLMLAGLLLATSLHSKENAPVSQSSTGDQSPVINAGGDATVNYGLNEEKLKAILQEREDNLIKKIRAAGGDEQERRLLDEQLKTVQAQKDDLKKSLEEEIARRKAADKALAEMKGQLPDARIAEAKKSLTQGDTKAAEKVFDDVVDKEGKAVVLAAYQSGKLAEGRLDYAKAMRLYTKAVAFEEDNPDYLQAAGMMARTVGDYSHAQEWLERLLKIREAERKDDIELALAQNWLAYVYYDQGRYNEAELLLKRALVIREEKLGKDHPDVAESLNNLAVLYRNQGRYDKLELLHKRALVIREQKLGKDHPDLSESLNNLALLYYAQSRYAEAEPLLKRALEALEKRLGKDHPNVATSLNNLAMLYDAQGRYAEAEPLLKRALVIKEQKLGKDHPDVAQGLNNLAGLYDAQGRHAEAEPLLQRAIAIMKAKFPGGHPDLDIYQKNYDELKRKQAGQ